MSFKLDLNTPSYKGTVSVNTGLFIDGKWVDPVEGGTIDVVNPTNGKKIVSVSVGTAKDVDIAVEAARKAFKESWGLKVPGVERGKMLSKLADLIEANSDELAALESLNVGKPFLTSKNMDVAFSAVALRHYASQADKIKGETIESSEQRFTYTRREPYGVVGGITPWNAPLLMLINKIGPAIAAGNVVVLKPSEFTPLTSLKVAGFVNEAGFPPGVINIVNGLGSTVGHALSFHPHITRISFTGSTLTGRKIQEASAKSNLKVVTLELGGKSPNIIFDDCDIAQTAKWSAKGVYLNMGQACIAGSRIFVQEGIYDKFLAAFKEETKAWSQHTGDPFDSNTQHGPQVSQIQFDRVMGYIDSARQDGATILTGGSRHGNEGYFIEPTIITDTRPDMKVIKEEIFGPVASIIKFKTEQEVIEMANNTTYGLACGLFTQNGARATRVAHALEAGTAWVNCFTMFDVNAPFGGYKQSGIGREFGTEGINEYTQIKSVHVNLGIQL
ncbi:aldehyde dehydrogenase [Marasmius fiardii PR-910]|nr:aldehyde dehydrogenase [Marasmius fiardii PR-910]